MTILRPVGILDVYWKRKARSLLPLDAMNVILVIRDRSHGTIG